METIKKSQSFSIVKLPKAHLSNQKKILFRKKSKFFFYFSILRKFSMTYKMWNFLFMEHI